MTADLRFRSDYRNEYLRREYQSGKIQRVPGEGQVVPQVALRK